MTEKAAEAGKCMRGHGRDQRQAWPGPGLGDSECCHVCVSLPSDATRALPLRTLWHISIRVTVTLNVTVTYDKVGFLP